MRKKREEMNHAIFTLPLGSSIGDTLIVNYVSKACISTRAFFIFAVIFPLYFHFFLCIFSDPPPRDGYAVIVWLHSGDFARGNASELNPFQLVYKQKMIVVTVAYRLGIFGFFTSMDDEAPGNFGLMDQAAALQWIKRNIKLFNGNPNSVTLMGHGSGAVSASLHLTSGEWSAGLFQRAIIMSGSMLTPSVVRDPTSYRGAIDRVSQEFGCDRRPTSRMMDCLRNVDISILVKKNPVVDWMPVIGKGLNRSLPFIRDDPINLLLTNELQNITLMIGFTDMEDVLDVSTGEVLAKGLSNEMYETMTKDILLNELSELESSNDTECSDGGGYSIQPVIDAFNFVYKPFPPTTDPSELRRKYIEFSADRAFAAPTFALAAAMSKTSQVFVYRFDIKPKTSAVAELLPEWSGVPHNFDLIFSWGMPYWLQLKNQTQWSSEDKLFSDIVMTLWANFAKFSNPTELGVSVHWNNFTENDQRVLIIDRSFNMSDSKSFNYHGIQFWNDYYPKVVNFASQCCNATSGAMSTTIPPSKHLTLANICSITFVYIVSVVIQFELL